MTEASVSSALVAKPSLWQSWLVRLVMSAAIIGLLLGVQWVLSKFISDYVVQIIITAGINIILATSLNLINGITGQFSLGHAGFMAIGAYAGATFTYYAGVKWVEAAGGSIFAQIAIFVIALILAALAAAFAGWLVGLPSLRLRGDYLAIVTLGFGQIIIVLIRTVNEVGGASGFSGLPLLTGFAWVYALVVLCVLTIRNIDASALGRSMRAIRDDEIAASAVGINTTRIKITAFIVSSMWAGVAGALNAHYLQSIDPNEYMFQRSVEIVVMVVLGGLGSITGSVITAVLLTGLSEVLRGLTGAVVVGVLLILLAAALSLPRYKQQLKQGALGWFLWLRWPVLSLALVGVMLQTQRALLVQNQAALRSIIYSLILIVLMLLRPQGLLGRNEFGWYLFRQWPFRRKALSRRAQDEQADQGAAGTLE